MLWLISASCRSLSPLLGLTLSFTSRWSGLAGVLLPAWLRGLDNFNFLLDAEGFKAGVPLTQPAISVVSCLFFDSPKKACVHSSEERALCPVWTGGALQSSPRSKEIIFHLSSMFLASLYCPLLLCSIKLLFTHKPFLRGFLSSIWPGRCPPSTILLSHLPANAFEYLPKALTAEENTPKAPPWVQLETILW